MKDEIIVLCQVFYWTFYKYYLTFFFFFFCHSLRYRYCGIDIIPVFSYNFKNVK
jgi:hypothetical protein